jgi:hypothetical protein
MTQSTPGVAGPGDGRSAKIAIIANTATGLRGKRENGTKHIVVRLDMHLGPPSRFARAILSPCPFRLAVLDGKVTQ